MSGKDNPFLKIPLEMPMTHRYTKNIGPQAEDTWPLVALSGMGVKLYTHIFEGMKIEDHSVRYDYAG